MQDQQHGDEGGEANPAGAENTIHAARVACPGCWIKHPLFGAAAVLAQTTEGQLTEAERAEYAGYVRANKFIAILRRQARQLLGAA
jgi:hypothetical protein